MAAVIPPWLKPANFLDAAQSGARIGLELARLQSQNQRRSDRGGGGTRNYFPTQTIQLPKVVKELPQEPTGPYIGGTPGSPVLVDPERQNKPDQSGAPFTFNGKQFITNDAGNVVEYSAPKIEPKLKGGQSTGYFKFDDKTGKYVLEIPPAPKAEKTYNVPVTQSKSGSPITVPMTIGQLESKYHQFPEFGKTNAISQILRNFGRDQRGETNMLTSTMAKEFLAKAGGDRKKAEAAAKSAGFTW